MPVAVRREHSGITGCSPGRSIPGTWNKLGTISTTPIPYGGIFRPIIQPVFADRAQRCCSGCNAAYRHLEYGEGADSLGNSSIRNT